MGSFNLLFVSHKVCKVIFIGANWALSWLKNNKTAILSVTCFCHYAIFAKTHSKIAMAIMFFLPKCCWFMHAHCFTTGKSLSHGYTCPRIKTSLITELHHKKDTTFIQEIKCLEHMLTTVFKWQQPNTHITTTTKA